MKIMIPASYTGVTTGLHYEKYEAIKNPSQGRVSD